jgi:hypothetical protein
MAYEDLDDYSVGAAGSDTFDVVIPDLDPNSEYPIQFRWQFVDKTLGKWSVSKLLNTPEIERPESTNIVAQWITLDSGAALQITWDAPALANGFVVYLTAGATTVPFGHTLDKTKTQQKLIITAQDIRSTFAGVFETNLSGLLKTTYIDTSTSGATFVIPPYSDPLNGAAILDTDWLITAVDKGISVSWNAIATSGTYWETVVYKSSTQNGTYVAVGSARNAPVMIEEINTVWIKIRHRLTTGGYSAYSNAKEAKAYIPIVFDTTPPNEVTVNSATWSGNDLLINYTMPATDPGTRFKITLTTGIYTGYFYDYFPSTSGTFTYKITNDAIFKQLSSNQATSYTGKFISVDSADNPTSGTNFSTGTLANPGAGETPTFILTGITNGYTATWTAPSWATYTKVWEGTASGFTPNDATNLVYSGSSPAIIKTLGRTDPYNRKYIKIRNFGPISGQQSEFYSAEQYVDPIDALTADIIAPNAPVVGTATPGIDTSGTMGFNGFINLTWTAVSDSTLRGYRIRFRPYKAASPFENYSYVDSPGTGTTYRLDGLALGATYEIAIASYDEYNNTSSSYNSYTNQLISGTPAMSNYITAGAAGFQFGSGIKDKTGSQNASAQGLYLSNSNYWYLTAADTAQFKIGGASTNYVTWDGATLKIDGDLGVAGGTTIGGNISMKNSGASIYAGTLSAGGALTTDGFLLNSNGLSIKKGSINLRLDTTDGGIYAEYGQIAGWTIDSSKLQRGTAGTYTGISSSGTYAIWAGSTSSAGDASAKFSVTPAGAVSARNITIYGDGTTNKLLDVASNFWVKNDGSMYATSAQIEGTINATAGVFKGTVDVGTGTNPSGVLRVSSGTGTILIGTNALIDGTTTAAITASSGSTTNFYVRASDGYLMSKYGSIGGWSIGTDKLSAGGGATAVGLSTAGTYAFWAGAGTPDTSTPFSVTNAGVLRATGAIISGAITVTSGRIGNQTLGWNINGTNLESYGTPDGTNKVILNSNTGEISGAKISSTKFVGSAFYIGSTDSATDKILSNGTFSLGNGTMTYSGSGDISLNGATLQFTGASNIIFGDDNNYGGDATVVLNQNKQLTTGRAFHYGGTTVPISTNTSRQIYNSKTGVYNSVAFVAGDIWMTVD